MAQDSDGVFLCAEFSGFCFFHYNLNSTFSICNSGQTLTSRKSVCLFISKVTTGSDCLGVADRWNKSSWPITLRCKRETNTIPDCFWHRSFANYSLPLDEIKFTVLSFVDSMFFNPSLLSEPNRLKSFIFKHHIAFFTLICMYWCHKKTSPHFNLHLPSA